MRRGRRSIRSSRTSPRGSLPAARAKRAEIGAGVRTERGKHLSRRSALHHDSKVPEVGAVGFWYGTAARRVVRALRLPSGAWVGTGEDPVDAGGTLPGCWPTREQVNGNANPVYVITGFDYQEADIDARSSGGSFWRIQFGRVDVPGAVRVTDLVSGRSARVADGHLF